MLFVVGYLATYGIVLMNVQLLNAREVNTLPPPPLVTPFIRPMGVNIIPLRANHLYYIIPASRCLILAEH